jgi:hypothetical protein
MIWIAMPAAVTDALDPADCSAVVAVRFEALFHHNAARRALYAMSSHLSGIVIIDWQSLHILIAVFAVHLPTICESALVADDVKNLVISASLHVLCVNDRTNCINSIVCFGASRWPKVIT